MTSAERDTKAWTADHDQIRLLQTRYCERFDARDADGYAELYTPDASVVAPWGQVIRGRDKLRKAVRNTPPGGWHKAGDTEIAVGGDVATATCRFEALAQDGVVDFGRYEDRYRRTPEGWLIEFRQVFVESRSYANMAGLLQSGDVNHRD